MVEPTNLHGAAPTWLDGEQGWLPRIRRAMAERGANAARTVVVLPYAQLLPLAKRLWAQEVGSGFAPTFTTTQQWAAARQLAMGSERRRPGALSFVAGTDWLQAQVRLEAAGFGRQARALAPQLVELTTALAPYALAQLPAQRPAWMARTRAVLSQGLDAPLLVIEQALVHAAVEWAGQSSYETDVLLQPDAVGPGTELVVLIPGHQADPLLEALQSAWADRACTLDAPTLPEPRPVRWQVAAHAEDEAQRAAACVVARLHDGLQPVALVSTDRALTRRVGALLAEAGVPVRDETGQKLSTLAAGAALMKCLRACQPGADTDTVIDWLIAAPDVAPEAVDALDAALRELAVAQRRQWTTAVAALRDRPERPEHADGGAGGRPTRTWPRTALAEPLEHIEAMREPWQGRRTLAAWQTLYRHTLEACGQWPTLLAWPGGEASLTALGLISGSALALSGWPPERSLSLAGFSAWVDVVLEAVTFVAPTHGDEPVVTLPMAQLLGRPFAALVLAGADERRLPPWPEAPGPWADAQRQALGWPTRMRWRDGVRSAWLTALQAPQADLVWRRLEFSGEALAASPWVQALPLTATEAADPRPTQTVAARPLSRPAPGCGGVAGAARLGQRL